MPLPGGYAAAEEGKPVAGDRADFISEPIQPVPGTFDTRAMAAGEPGLPARFTWRGSEYSIDRVLEKWKETSRCRSGADEQYVRKHWFKIRTTGGHEMKIYFDRQPRTTREPTRRWWLYTVSTPKGP